VYKPKLIIEKPVLAAAIWVAVDLRTGGVEKSTAPVRMETEGWLWLIFSLICR
jgi:hypothetical protein